MISFLSFWNSNASFRVLGIFSHLPWVTRWLDESVDFIRLGLSSINIASVIVDRRIQSGSTSRDLMFHIVSFSDVSIVWKQRVVLTKYKNNEDGKGIVQRTKKRLVAEGLTAIVAGYGMIRQSPFDPTRRKLI